MNTAHSTYEYTVLSDFTPIESRLEVSRSEFISYLQRVESEDEARACIDAQRRRYHDARHVCSAFVIGAGRQIQRSSDDGEPAGTAGAPMLQTLLSQRLIADSGATGHLSDICAVVVRYFGGIKLGTGGLVRAYTAAVVQALKEANLILRKKLRWGTIPVSFADAGKLENILRSHGFQVLGTIYTAAQAEIRIGVFDSAEFLNRAETALAELTAGSTRIFWESSSWVDCQ